MNTPKQRLARRWTALLCLPVVCLFSGVNGLARESVESAGTVVNATSDGGRKIRITIVGDGSAELTEKILAALKATGAKSVKLEEHDPESEPGLSSDHPVLKKLNSVVIPSIELVNTPFNDTLDFLRSRCHELDSEPDPNRKGVNIVVRSPKVAEEVTATLSNKTLGEALDTIAWLTGRTLSVTASAVVFSPATEPLMKGASPLPKPEADVTEATSQKIRAIVIPNIEFRDTPLIDSLDFLRARAAELDPETDPSRKGVDIIYKQEFEKKGSRVAVNPQISLSLNNVSLEEALNFTVELAGMKMEIRGNVVRISQK